MKTVFYVLLILICCNYGCGKTDAISAASTSPAGTGPGTNRSDAKTGDMKGVISPAGAVLDITVSILVNGQFTKSTVKPDADGRFFFKHLPTGNGSIDYTPAKGYTMGGLPVSVTGGMDTDLGTIDVSLLPGSITGAVSPAGAAVLISLKSQADPTKTFTIKPDPKTGVFNLSNLPVGAYALHFEIATGYNDIDDRKITISTAKETNTDIVRFDAKNPGSISGTIYPANALVSINATHIGSDYITYSVVPDSKGHFTIPNVVPTYYTLVVTPNSGSGLFAPLGSVITVLEGKESDAGILTLTTTPPPYTISAKIDGAGFNTNAAGGTYNSAQRRMTINAGALTLVIADLTSPGDHVCNSTSASYISHTAVYSTHPGLSDGLMTIVASTTRSAGGSGMIRVTAINQEKKTISGTFECTLIGSGGRKVITNGILNNVPYRSE